MVIHFSSKEIWGEFVSILLFSLLAIQIINWGNKEYLLRRFSKKPSEIKNSFTTSLVTRLPLVFLFSIIGFLYFKIDFGIYIFFWILGRYLIHSYEVLIIFEKKFTISSFIEISSFSAFCLTFYFLKSILDLKLLLILYSFFQLLKGVLYSVFFNNVLSFKNVKIDTKYYKASFWFFLLSFLGFLASKIDVYIVNQFGNKTVTSDYQIINSLLVFIMSIAAFIYVPYTKNIYRTNEIAINKIKKAVSTLGFIIVPVSILIVYEILYYFLKLDLSFWFYLIAFFYVFPSYLYGIEIVSLFKQRKEKTVVNVLVFGAVANFLLSFLLLSNGYGILGGLSGSAIAQILVLIIFKWKN